ncbi:MAG: response regulator [Planctomycetes bacterium]|jgi:CheY-like chemotaxis protein|nr:response regulator [Planctomycetota bacterium]HNZ66097.1 response regulator [Planctomycetota bacterium]HON44229.1 response regulator [Planctomycetota bacterium]HPY75281.1 response regulator [Planctomycetota bacterium]HQB00944.1 response regulator [Planctomycetota bacterium]
MQTSSKHKQSTDILIVDDDPSLQVLISEILKLEGYTFDIAKTGKEAFKFAMNNNYKLILMDIKMPEWDGLTAIRSLDFVQEIQKIIVVSAYLDTAILQELSKEPLVVGWLEKPFDPSYLIEMVENVIPKNK